MRYPTKKAIIKKRKTRRHKAGAFSKAVLAFKNVKTASNTFKNLLTPLKTVGTGAATEIRNNIIKDCSKNPNLDKCVSLKNIFSSQNQESSSDPPRTYYSTKLFKFDNNGNENENEN